MDQQLTEVIEKLGTSIEEFKSSSDKKIDALSKKLEQIEIRQARPNYNGGPAPETRNTLPEIRPGQLRMLKREHRMADLMPEPSDDDRCLDLGKIIKGMVTNNWTDADLEKKTMAQTPGSSGGYLLPDFLSTRVIDLARARSVIVAAGAQTVKMEGANLKIAKLAGDPTAHWRGELQAIAPSDASFEQITLTPRTLAVLCKMSVEVVEDSLNLAKVVEDALSQAIAVELDRACMFGNGAPGGEPCGIATWPGVAEVTTVGIPTSGTNPYTHILTGIQNTLEANYSGDLTDLACIIHPRDWTLLESMADDNYNPLQMPKSVAGLKWLITTAIPTTQTIGGNSDCSTTFIGSFQECLIGMRTTLTIEVTRVGADSDSSAFTNLETWIRGYLRADFAIGRPAMITKATGVRVGT